MQDLRFALRQLLRSPLHTLTVILILALAIGANTAIFSLVRSVLLKPLPYPQPEQIAWLSQQRQGVGSAPFSWPNVQDLRTDNHSFSAVGIYSRQNFTVTRHGPAEQVAAASVNADYFRVLGVPALLGRPFNAKEDAAGAPKTVVVRESFWRRKLGGDPAVLGQSLVINSQAHTIVGVMPNTITNPGNVEFWVPIAPFADDDTWRNRRNQPGLFAFARLREGVTLEQAAADVQAIGRRLQHDFPGDNSEIMPVVRPLLDVLTSNYRESLLMLMAAVGLLLVIACTNVAGLQLVRGFSRAHEFSVRAALGAGRSPLIRLLLTESLVLACLGGALGIMFALWSVDGIRALSPDVPRFQALAVDRLVLGFSVALSLGTGVLSGLWPAWRATHVDLRASLHAGGPRGTAGGGAQRMRQGLVTLQVALTVVLLAGAGLFARSLVQVLRFPYGFDPANLLLVTVSLPDTAGRYDTDEKRIAFFEQAKAGVAVLPGVRSVGINYSAPLRMDWSQLFDVAGRPEFPAGKEPFMEMGVVDTDYFRTLGLPILKGRNFDRSDKLGGPRAIIIDQRMADTFWPGEDPIGKEIMRGNRHAPPERRRTIVVGVVPTVAVDGVQGEGGNFQGYLAQSQTGGDTLNLVIRTNVAPRSLIPSVSAVVAGIDPDVPTFDAASMDELIARENGSQRTYALLVGLFAAAALLLSGLGLYGVVSQAVNARRREIGIRMALGALHRQVISLVLRQGLAPLALGLVLGLGGALLGGRLVASMLYHVSAYDATALAVAVFALGAVGLAALWLPARRAAKVDPMVALRAE